MADKQLTVERGSHVRIEIPAGTEAARIQPTRPPPRAILFNDEREETYAFVKKETDIFLYDRLPISLNPPVAAWLKLRQGKRGASHELTTEVIYIGLTPTPGALAPKTCLPVRLDSGEGAAEIEYTFESLTVTTIVGPDSDGFYAYQATQTGSVRAHLTKEQEGGIGFFYSLG
jgi:hypothetical protein